MFAKTLHEKCWGPLLTTLQESTISDLVAVPSLSVRLWLGDCLLRLNPSQPETGQFDARYLKWMDYALWNLLLATMPLLKKTTEYSSSVTNRPFTPFLQTESIIGMSTCLEHMFYEELPYQLECRQLLGLMGWNCSEVDAKPMPEGGSSSSSTTTTTTTITNSTTAQKNEEKVVRVRWFHDNTALDVSGEERR